MYEYKATVRKVIDGDTVDLDISLGFHVYLRVRCRLAGINTPEMNDPDPAVRAKAEEAKAFLKLKTVQSIPGVTIRSEKPFSGDKYGRWLVDLNDYYGLNLNAALVAAGLAKPYMTGTTP